MGNENGTWIMHGLAPDDPGCLHTPEQLLAYIDEVGFLPLFAGGIPGFSVEEHTESGYWWTGDAARDPWEWREILARSGRVVYGKFFARKAGFVSLSWLPCFANWRRDGYDFDARFSDELATLREKKIMDCVEEQGAILSNVLKEKAGFGKDGDKNFEGVLTGLQMKGYLCVSDFRRRQNAHGAPYGWPVAVYTRPEDLVGYESLSNGYREDPAASRARLIAKVKAHFPEASDAQLSAL